MKKSEFSKKIEEVKEKNMKTPTFRKVSREEFFEKISNLDIHPFIQGKFPYTSIWKNRDGIILGKSVDEEKSGSIRTTWFLCD